MARFGVVQSWLKLCHTKYIYTRIHIDTYTYVTRATHSTACEKPRMRIPTAVSLSVCVVLCQCHTVRLHVCETSIFNAPSNFIVTNKLDEFDRFITLEFHFAFLLNCRLVCAVAVTFFACNLINVYSLRIMLCSAVHNPMSECALCWHFHCHILLLDVGTQTFQKNSSQLYALHFASHVILSRNYIYIYSERDTHTQSLWI